MRSIQRFRHFMSSTVLVAPRTGMDDYGKPVYGTDVAYRAHLSHKRSAIRSAQGEVIDSQQTIHLMTNVNIFATARVTLSTGDVGSTESWAIHPPILGVDQSFDQTGSHHVVLYL